MKDTLKCLKCGTVGEINPTFEAFHCLKCSGWTTKDGSFSNTGPGDKGEQGDRGITEKQTVGLLYAGGEVIKRTVYPAYLEYKAFTKEDYRRYLLSRSKDCSGFVNPKVFDDIWERLSKGYNFVIVADGDDGDLHFFSVDYFNNEMLR